MHICRNRTDSDVYTGFGTPNFDKLVKEAFKKKQPSSYDPPSYGSKGY
jgi:hypothetical protein